MRQKRDRFFALFGAILIFVTAAAFSALVIWQMVTGTDNAADQAATAPTCQSTDIEEALPVPEAFKPEGDVTELESTDIVEGQGEQAKAGDCLVVKYYGTLATTGEKFDENYTATGTQNDGFAFEVGAGSVIPGWDEGLIGMKVGGERRLVIPSEKAYRDQAAGSIPANSDLVFNVKLLRIKN